MGWAGERAPGSQRVLTPSEFLTAADYELPRTDEPCYCDPVHNHDEESAEGKENFEPKRNFGKQARLSAK